MNVTSTANNRVINARQVLLGGAGGDDVRIVAVAIRIRNGCRRAEVIVGAGGEVVDGLLGHLREDAGAKSFLVTSVGNAEAVADAAQRGGGGVVDVALVHEVRAGHHDTVRVGGVWWATTGA